MLSTADRAVCRRWHSAVRHYGPSVIKVPLVALPDGRIFAHPDGYRHQITSFPDGAVCVGSTDAWLALICTGNNDKHTYLLHKPFPSTRASVPLSEFDATVGNVPKWFQVRKVLLRSGRPDDLIAVTTNDSKYPVILIRPGKGAWFADTKATTNFEGVIDVALLGDTLCGISRFEDLVSLPIAFDGDGVPVVTGIERVILRHPMADYDSDAWSDTDNDDPSDVDELPQVLEDNREGLDEAGDDDVLDNKEEGEDDEAEDDDVLDSEEEGEDDDDEYELAEGIDFEDDGDDFFVTMRYFVESRGKLLMVRRQLQCPKRSPSYTRKVDVFEANLATRMWEPMTGGLEGHALFVSKRFSKSILALGWGIKEDTIFFIDTGEAFDARSQTISKSQSAFVLGSFTWIFTPVLVV